MRLALAHAGAAIDPPAGPSKRLIIAFAFPPFATASGNVMARRLGWRGERVDVISNDMSGREGVDLSLYGVIAPLIGQHLVLDAENWPARAQPFADFADKTVAALGSGRFGAPPYAEIYSRSMWAQSHFAAAAALAAGHGESWTAEFSDPCRRDLNGQPAGAPADDDWLERSRIADLLRARGHAVPKGRPLMFWAEYLPFCLADRLIFTNEVQRRMMLSQPEDPADLRARAASVSGIAPQPGPGPLMQAAIPLPRPLRGPLWLGYFGNTNPRRGLSDLLHAMSGLPAHLGGRIRLLIHGQPGQDLHALIRALNIAPLVDIHPSLDYLDALARMRAMDWLFVNDTASTGDGNPFLPSKLADYRASGRPVLAFAEPGSPLSGATLPPGSIRVDMGDARARLDALIRIASAGEETLQSQAAGGTWPADAEKAFHDETIDGFRHAPRGDQDGPSGQGD
ncbi:MAG: hypothetical protein Q4G26_00355 [Paracoccus sp. (in: a-proteobacteria)]|nr:hypothetical protein [Paracoccus sp. (in: a-proteobacteria)]